MGGSLNAFDEDRAIEPRRLVSVRPAPSGQVARLVRLREPQRPLQRRREARFHLLARDPWAQEVRPQELAERRGVLGEAAGAPKLARQAAVGIVLQVGDAL